jgi:hypothetical protein
LPPISPGEDHFGRAAFWRCFSERRGDLLKVEPRTVNSRPGAWICVLGLVICLSGCQPRAYQAPLLPPPLPPAATAPRPERPILFVGTNHLILRACPGKDCPKIYPLELNAEVEKIGETENWAQIRVKKDGNMGWVYSRYLSQKRVEVATGPKRKRKEVKRSLATKPPKPAEGEGEAQPKKPPFPTPPPNRYEQEGFQVM